MDQEVIGVDRTTRGPVERRLEEFGDLLGLCFGAWGEASEGVHQLVQYLAEKRTDFLGLQRGRPGSEEELGRCWGRSEGGCPWSPSKGRWTAFYPNYTRWDLVMGSWPKRGYGL